MFKCEVCGNTSKLGEKPTTKVIETRIKIYEYGRYRRKKTTQGSEIVREARMCGVCGILYDEEHAIPESEVSELIAA